MRAFFVARSLAMRPTHRLLAGTATAALLLCAAPVFAQTESAVLQGTLSQGGSDAILDGVIVTIVETGQTTVSDAQGLYRFGNLAPGTYQVSVSYLGYPTQVESVTLAAGATTHDIVIGAEAGTIVVTGQRAAQAEALNKQRAASNTRAVVSADQAGRFPDYNAAEALRRVPGVSVQREVDAGEGRYISIRGLDSGLNNTQINGMDAAQPEKENRRVPLDMVQTSAIASITVHKTLLPDQEADGIGGAVVLETATAFDYKKTVADFTASGFYHDLAGKVSPTVQGTLATRFGADKQFGILVSGAYSKRKTKGFVFYQDEDYMALVEDDPSQGVVPLEYHIAEYENDRTNISANVALNWAVSGATELVFRGSFNRLYDKELSRAIYFEGGTDEYDDDGKLILTEPGSANIFDEYEETELTQQSYVLRGVTHSGALTLDYGLGYSTGKREEPNDYEVGFTKQLQSNLFGYDTSGRFPVPNLTDADKAAIGNPDGYVLGYNDIDLDDSMNTRYAGHLDVSYEPSGSWLRLVKAGVKVERSHRRMFEANVIDLQGPLTLRQFGMGGLVDTGTVGAPYAPFLSLNLANLKNWKDYAQKLVDTNPDFSNDYVEDGAIPRDGDSYTSNEDIYAGYLMGKAVWGKLEVIGGVRVDHTRIASDNYEALELEDEDPVFTKVKGKASYTSVLPRLQVNYRASDDLVFRGAFYTSIARPEPQYISGATEIEEEDGKVDVTVGNPGMKPAYAYNFDFSAEKYLGSIGVISGDLYYKKIDRFIFSGISPETEGDIARFANDPRLVGKVIDDVITYTNGKNADIYGAEINIVHQFTKLPGALGGLGVYANATLQHSKADTGIEGISKGAFLNAPNVILNGALTYQKYGIEGSLAYSWRDRQAVGFSSYDERIVEQAYGSLDGQLRYAFNRHFAVFVNAVDILNSGKDPIVDQRYGAGSHNLVSTTYTGRTVTFGINARL
jgi:TonB-dependent receptor